MLLPYQCQPADECLCLRGSDTDAIDRELAQGEECLARLAALTKGVDTTKAAEHSAQGLQAWQTPTAVIGGVLVSFAVGGVLGWLVARHR